MWRIQIFKTLAVSQIVYIATMKTPPHQFIEVHNEFLKDFVWNKSCPEIKHSNLVGNYEDGYKNVNISTKFTALKIT